MTYQTDVLGEFANPESGLLSAAAIDAATRKEPFELPFQPGGHYAAAIDPSDGKPGGNGWSLAIGQRVRGEQGQPFYRTVLVREWRGLSPDECLKQAADDCRRYNLSVATTDQYAAASNADLARRHGLTLIERKTTAPSKLADWTNYASLMSTGAIELSPDPQLRTDLLGVKKKTTATGSTIVLPRTADGRHADKAAAHCAMIAALLEGSGTTTSQPNVDDGSFFGGEDRSWGWG
jgi:hypothetical protein